MTLEDDLMVNMGKPLILAIGALVALASIALACRPGYEVVPNVDGREYVVNRWTGRVYVCDPGIDNQPRR